MKSIIEYFNNVSESNIEINALISELENKKLTVLDIKNNISELSNFVSKTVNKALNRNSNPKKTVEILREISQLQRSFLAYIDLANSILIEIDGIYNGSTSYATQDEAKKWIERSVEDLDSYFTDTRKKAMNI